MIVPELGKAHSRDVALTDRSPRDAQKKKSLASARQAGNS